MKERKFVIVVIFIMLILGIAVVLHLFSPRPIIADPSSCHIIRLQYNPAFNQDMDARIEVTDYYEKDMLDCLNRYTEHRTLEKATTADWIGDIELEITIDTEQGIKNIRLGNKNYSYQSYGKAKYQISDADMLRLELLALMNKEEHGGTVSVW